MSRLVVLEGLDGAGTTTQARRAVAHLERQGILVHPTREPSDNPIGRLLREFLTGRNAIEGQRIDPATLALLFSADRMDHLQREVEPRLDAGHVVVSDRWYHSSLAYQGWSTWDEKKRRGLRLRGLRQDGLAWVATLNAHARRPDLTIFLRVDPEVATRRRLAAGRAEELFDDLETQRQVDAGYRATLELVASRGERVEILDGEASEDEVAERIAALLDGLVSETPALRPCSTCGRPGHRPMEHAGWDPTRDPQ